MAPTGKQRAVAGTGSLSSAFLSLGFLPFVEAVVGESPLTEVFFNVPLGNVSGNDRHLASHQVGELLLLLQDPAVKFLDIHCLFNK